MPKVDIPDWAPDAGHHAATGEDNGPSLHRILAQAGGLGQFGAHLERLPPGSRSGPRHRHEAEDEMIYVLSGTVTLVEDDLATALSPGDAAAWPAGHPAHHRLENRSGSDATYLVVGTRAARDVVRFADHDLVLHLARDADGRLTRTRTTRAGAPLD